MKIEKRIKEETLSVKLAGRLDTLTSSEFQKEVDDIPANINTVIFDMLILDYISSSGLRVLLGVAKEMKKREGKVEVINVNNEIREVLKITGFDKILFVV